MDTQKNKPNDRPHQGSVFYGIKHWLRKGHFPPRRAREMNIHLTTDGLEIHDQGRMFWGLRWDDVVRVVAFKLDRFSTDTICVGFQCADDADRVWCVEEEWTGYKALEKKLDEYTNGAWRQKWSSVAHPTFEFNWTEVWERPDSQPLEDNPILIWRSPPETPDPSA